MIAAAIPAIAGGIFQGISGIVQGNKAKKLEREAKMLEGGIDTDLNRMSQTGLPGQEYAQAQQGIDRNLAFGINALRDRRSALAGISALTQRAMDTQLGLDVANAKQRVANQGQYINFRQGLMNQRRSQAQQMAAAGQQNAFSGFMNALTAGSKLIGDIKKGQNVVSKVGEPKPVMATMNGVSPVQAPQNPVSFIPEMGGMNDFDFSKINGRFFKI